MYVYEGRVAVSRRSGDTKQQTMLVAGFLLHLITSAIGRLLRHYTMLMLFCRTAATKGWRPPCSPRRANHRRRREKAVVVRLTSGYVRTGHPMSLLTAHQPGARGNT